MMYSIGVVVKAAFSNVTTALSGGQFGAISRATMKRSGMHEKWREVGRPLQRIVMCVIA
jgi:hypothetical protein